MTPLKVRCGKTTRDFLCPLNRDRLFFHLRNGKMSALEGGNFFWGNNCGEDTVYKTRFLERRRYS